MKIRFLSVVLFVVIYTLPLSAETYDLESFLNLVKTNSKDLQLAQKELDMAKAIKKEAWATALPKLFAQGNYKRNILENFLYVDFPDEEGGTSKQKFKITRNNEYLFTANLNQTLFSFKVGNALTAAKQYEKMTQQVYEASRQGILAFSKKGFYQGLLLKKFWEVQQSSEQSAKDNYENIKKKFENGLVSEFQLLQAEVRWKNEIPKTLEAKRNYELLLANLKNFAGFDANLPFDLQGSLEIFPAKPERLEFNNILLRRPDFNAMLWEKELRNTNVSASFAEYYPYLSGDFIYYFSSISDYWRLENRNNNLIASLTLSIPLYTGGYTGAQVQKARVDLDKVHIRIEQTKEKIFNDLNNIYLRLDEAGQRILSAKETLKSAEKGFKIAEVSVESGVITQLELKDARIFFDQAMLNYYAAVYDYLDAYFDWEVAVGI